MDEKESKRVFCKDCKWFAINQSPYANVMNCHICKKNMRKTIEYNPVYGEIELETNYEFCKEKNVNMDCKDYEEKEKNK